jgi:uncharacterized protein YPO0396
LLEVERQQSSLKRQAQKGAPLPAVEARDARLDARRLRRGLPGTMRSIAGELAAQLGEISARETETAAQIAALEEIQDSKLPSKRARGGRLAQCYATRGRRH